MIFGGYSWALSLMTLLLCKDFNTSPDFCTLGVDRYAISLDTHVNSSKCFPTLREIGAIIRRELLSRCELNDTLYSLHDIISVVPLSCVKVYVVVL